MLLIDGLVKCKTQFLGCNLTFCNFWYVDPAYSIRGKWGRLFFENILFGKKEMNFKPHWSRLRLKIFNLSKIKLQYLLLKKLLKFLDHHFGCWVIMTPLKVTITFIIFWHFLRFYQILLSPQLKRSAIISYKNGIYELPNGLRLKDFRKLGNVRKI